MWYPLQNIYHNKYNRIASFSPYLSFPLSFNEVRLILYFLHFYFLFRICFPIILLSIFWPNLLIFPLRNTLLWHYIYFSMFVLGLSANSTNKQNLWRIFPPFSNHQTSFCVLVFIIITTEQNIKALFVYLHITITYILMLGNAFYFQFAKHPACWKNGHFVEGERLR